MLKEVVKASVNNEGHWVFSLHEPVEKDWQVELVVQLFNIGLPFYLSNGSVEDDFERKISPIVVVPESCLLFGPENELGLTPWP